MGNYANFYNSKNGDRVYNADSFEEWLTPFFTNGVFEGELLVTSSGGLAVNVATGNAFINGKLRKFDEATKLELEKAEKLLPRIDSIVVRRNDTERNFTLEVVKGTASSNPVAPDLVRDNGIYDLCLAHIYVGASVIEISQTSIVDTRMDSDVCGYVVATVEQIDFSQVTLQWEQYLKEFKASNLANFTNWEEETQNAITLWTTAYKDSLDTFVSEQKTTFEAWFENIKNQLSEDAAGNLQNEVDDLIARLEVTEDMIQHNDYRSTIMTDDSEYLMDENDLAILNHWKYKEETSNGNN